MQSSDARNTTTFAISSGVPALPDATLWELLSVPKTSSRAKDWAATWFSLEWEGQREVCD